jgi:hypothetical protein
MQIPKRAVPLRIFIGEDDRAEGRPLYDAIVPKARETNPARGRRLQRGRAQALLVPARPAPRCG